MSVKLSNITVVSLAELLELPLPEVEFTDEFDGTETLRSEALAMNTWRSLKYSTYHRIQSFHSAFVQTLISGLP